MDLSVSKGRIVGEIEVRQGWKRQAAQWRSDQDEGVASGQDRFPVLNAAREE